MNESISEIRRLLQEIVGHVKADTTADKRKAVAKLERIAALASTLALTIQAAEAFATALRVASEGNPLVGQKYLKHPG